MFTAKKRLSLLVFSMILIGLSGTPAYAHEMYFTKNGSTITTVPLRWINKNTSTGRLKVLIDKQYLKDSWATYFEDARVAWHSSNVPAEFTTSSTSVNTYMATASADYWKQRFPGDSSWSEVMGVTDLYDTNGTVIDSYAKASASTKQIKGANIYVKPNPYNNSVFDYRSTMSHEFGHVLCLGHSHLAEYSPANPSTDPSIMSYDYLALKKSYLPQTHEVNDVKAMYGY
ncbi:hypothetical protein [Cohnella sp. REN36]|uniref:hypothetical protein n=1 Tax=Cohnella sp. REN36 TaxID=2887347 RepID=UPI001D14094C|nr:hypothetical protein [Cohnella sp. REN36]MCC3373865.1 hypothetical protein [Cohnella sp. REN36]